MNGIISAALDRSRTVISILLGVLIAGTVAFVGIPKEAAPDVQIPLIYVSMSHEGISPADAERMLLRPMEQELRTVEGVKEMRSNAYEGGANVLLEFEAGFDADKALSDVRERVDIAKPELPAETEEPKVNEINISLFPIITIALSGEVPERTLLRLARDLERALEGIPDVLEVDIAGDRDEQVEMIVDPVAVESYGLSTQELAAFLARSNRLVAAGALDTGQGRFAVKVPGLIESVQDVLALPIKVEGDAVVRVGDIAEVRRGFKDPEAFARIDGRPALALDVQKRIGANIIHTVDRVRAVTEAERAKWPDEVEVAYLQDQSVEIETMLGDLRNNVISAILLVMVVVVAFLGLRSGLLVGIAIPGSFLMGILVLAIMGLTVNMVVLFSLILAVGMLVDGAIVVTEYADRKMSEGESRRTAYRQAAARMAWPVIASTMTTLAAFMPLLFWTGVVGEFMKFLPITLVATLAASLLMALIFVPTLGAWFGAPGGADPRAMRALAASEGGDPSQLAGPTGAYTRVLGGALRHPAKIVLTAVALLIAVQAAYAVFGKGVEFFPDVEPERAILQVHARGNLSVMEKDYLMREVERRILGTEGVSTFYTRAGGGSQAVMQDRPEDVIGSIQIEFADWDQRRPAREIMAEIRRRTADLAGIEVELREQEGGPPVGKPVQVELSGGDIAALNAAAETVRGKLERMAGLIDIEDSRPLPGVQWALRIDRAQAAKFGTDVSTVGEMVKMVTRGLKFSAYRPDDAVDEIDIVARFPEEYRSIEQIDRLRVQTPGGLVPIGNFVERVPQPKVGEIRRVDGQRVVTVKADVAPGVLADDKVGELRAWLAGEAGLDRSIGIAFKGEDEEQKASQAFLGKAFAVALMAMAVILVTQFNSFYSAFLILSAVIMSTLGVMLGLLITGQAFGIVMSGIGVIALAGIVVNNNIVLIDTYDRLRQTVADPREAILRTGAQRLRPVLLTTATTILGLLPMVLGVNIDFVTREIAVGAPSTQWWRQLSVAISFGLAFATVLTLVVTPCALMVKANIAAWRRRRHQRKLELVEARELQRAAE